MKYVISRNNLYPFLLALFLLALASSQPCSVPRCGTCYWSNGGACHTCLPGYKLAGLSCCLNAIQNCLTCMSSADTCDTCTSQIFCGPYCDYCSNQMTNCVTCSSCSSCITCINNTYAINTATQKCDLCSFLLSHCSNCNSDTVCIACLDAPLIILNNTRCVSCGSVIENCLNCTALNVCTLCNTYYAVNLTLANATCGLCKIFMFGCEICTTTNICVKCSLGRIVTNGCSDYPGCTGVIQRPSTTPYCISCDVMEFLALPVDGTCICIKGFVVGQYCTEIIGCASILRNSSGDYCTSCNTNGMFYLENGTCHCYDPFWQDGHVCTQICGDGQVFVLPCDDGNLIDGDGCSSSCRIESGYECKAGTNHSASTCVYKGKITPSISCIYKVQSMNAFKIIIKFTPFISHLLLVNFNNFITFTFTKNCSVDSISFVGNSMEIFVNYVEDVEQSNVTIRVYFDTAYIISPGSVISTQINECDEDRLIYDPYAQVSYKYITVLLSKIISLIVLVVWLVGSYSHKMIGVQTLHTIHLIFIMQAFAPRYRPVVYYFNNLSNSLNIFQGLILSQPSIGSGPYQRLNYSSDLIYNIGLVAGIEFFLLIALGILQFFKQILKSQRQEGQFSQLSPDSPRLRKIKQFIYNLLVFPTFIGFLFSFMISLQVNSSTSVENLNKNYYMVTIVILIIIIATTIVFFSEWKMCLIRPSQQKERARYRPSYVPIYLTYILVLSSLILLSLENFIPSPLFILITITTIYLSFLILYRPYKNKIHNIGLLINQLGILLNLSWLISQDYLYIYRSIQQLIAFGLMGWIFLILLWALVRIVYELARPRVIERDKETEAKKKRLKSYQQYQQDIVKAINAEKDKNMNCYNLTVQLIRSRQEDYNKEINQNDYLHQIRKKFKYKIDEDMDLYENRGNNLGRLINNPITQRQQVRK